MIGILLKYVILDQCLSIAFDRVGVNLAKVSPEFAKRILVTNRKIHASFTIESAMDLQSFHSIDIKREMMNTLSYEIQSEIDSEVLGRVKALAERYADIMG